ncbi:uncharacterized protein BCR38DRAFT_501189 [Pseudomassariella vexata]|uniref:Uncharacterized protein n=1 Tax=Pseudomassariella vexata TaxID=1141098 RepID=A0A1Y2DG29_9PEZI|nr:uncharacterized protein BCR38DRAFT_501189 [Pseudomassariella vexata]ORY58253.1 hypothetical protein BCR38DRAFT_501189 [Pseudomassariella vexata]
MTASKSRKSVVPVVVPLGRTLCPNCISTLWASLTRRSSPAGTIWPLLASILSVLGQARLQSPYCWDAGLEWTDSFFVLTADSGDPGDDTHYAHTLASRVAIVVAFYRLLEAFLTSGIAEAPHRFLDGKREPLLQVARAPPGSPPVRLPSPRAQGQVEDGSINGGGRAVAGLGVSQGILILVT